jgi:hypothetical protein
VNILRPTQECFAMICKQYAEYVTDLLLQTDLCCAIVTILGTAIFAQMTNLFGYHLKQLNRLMVIHLTFNFISLMRLQELSA